MPDPRKDAEQFDIVIIGGGIGGTATANALRRKGFDVALFEQAHAFGEVGGGIVFRELSRALFAEWGILDDLKPKLARVEVMEVRDRSGEVLGTAPAGVEPGETHCAHRADVHNALVAKLRPDRVHLNHRLASVETRPEYAEAVFHNGRRVRASLVIGADGLRSVVRTLIDQSPMTFLKQVTNRTIAPASILPAAIPNDRIRIWQDGMRRLISLPIRGGTEISMNLAYGVETAPAKLWDSAPADELRTIFADFDPTVLELLDGRIAPITTHALYDKEPIERWSEGRVVLLGDAAHPMSPMNGQGANQAIQDAGALAAALVGPHRGNLAAALQEYQAVRGPATARIQMMSRQPPPALTAPSGLDRS